MWYNQSLLTSGNLFRTLCSSQRRQSDLSYLRIEMYIDQMVKSYGVQQKVKEALGSGHAAMCLCVTFSVTETEAPAIDSARSGLVLLLSMSLCSQNLYSCNNILGFSGNLLRLLLAFLSVYYTCSINIPIISQYQYCCIHETMQLISSP